MKKGYVEPGVVTGKPIALGGSGGRLEATGRGLLFVTRETLRRVGRDLPDSTVAIQGFGNVGSFAAKFLHDEGVNIIAISDADGAYIRSEGIDVTAAVAHVARRGSLRGFKSATRMPRASRLLELPVDILVPAALENQINATNAGRVRAKIVAEAANGPTTPMADEILFKRGRVVIPDILANAGGVTVSYFEWVQDLQEFFWDEHDINERLERIMLRAFDNVLKVSLEKNVMMRTAAYVLAVDKVAQATTIRGIYP